MKRTFEEDNDDEKENQQTNERNQFKQRFSTKENENFLKEIDITNKQCLKQIQDGIVKVEKK